MAHCRLKKWSELNLFNSSTPINGYSALLPPCTTVAAVRSAHSSYQLALFFYVQGSGVEPCVQPCSARLYAASANLYHESVDEGIGMPREGVVVYVFFDSLVVG